MKESDIPLNEWFHYCSIAAKIIKKHSLQQMIPQDLIRTSCAYHQQMVNMLNWVHSERKKVPTVEEMLQNALDSDVWDGFGTLEPPHKKEQDDPSS